MQSQTVADPRAVPQVIRDASDRARAAFSALCASSQVVTEAWFDHRALSPVEQREHDARCQAYAEASETLQRVGATEYEHAWIASHRKE